MNKLVVSFLAVVMVFIFSVSVSAAPVNLPTSVKEIKGTDYLNLEPELAFTFEVEGDFLHERKLDDQDGEIEASFYMAKLIFSTEKIDVYAGFGQAEDVEFNAFVSGATIKYEMKSQFAWCMGIDGVIYEWEGSRVKIFGDAKYRAIKDMDYEYVTIEGVQYAENLLLEGRTDAEWKEWHVALGVARKFEFIIPYIGMRYSDVRVDADITYSGVTYDLGERTAGESFGIFAGCAVMPLENLSIEAEGRFIDETAFTLRLVHQF